jgi:hypothetical protein
LLFAAALAVCGLVAASGQQAHAGYNVTLGSISPAGSNFTYTYNASITANQEEIVAGNFFRIFDFSGYVPGSATAPANWTISVANSNPTPPPNVILQHGDDPNIPNITFTYTGAVPLTGPVSLGDFTMQSIYSGGTLIFKDAAGQSTNVGTNPPSLIDSRVDVAVPALVPEPASVLSAGVGLILLGIGYVRSCRKPLNA